MPRRHKSTKSKPKGNSFNKSDRKIKKWNTTSDIPMDEEDQFHASRDKILLQGGDDDDDDEDEDEVFGLKGLADEDDEDYENEDENGDEDDLPKQQSKKPKGKKDKPTESSESNDSENSEEEEETWGRNKSAYYSSNAAELDSDDDEANELEEQEARRLQAKARENMGEDDFGLSDTIEDIRNRDEADELGEPQREVAPSLPQDKRALIRHLEKTSPETLALARDWDDTAWALMKTQAKIMKFETLAPDALSLGMVHLHYQTLLTYATTLAFYLHMRSSQKYAQRPDLLKSHPVLSRLLTLKQSLSTLEELDFAVSDDEDNSDIDDEDESLSLNLHGEEDLLDREQLWKYDQLNGLGAGELDDLLTDAEAFMTSESIPASKSKPKRKASSTEEPPKKKRKTESNKIATPVFDLVEPDYIHSKTSSSSSASANSDVADAYGEATSLAHADQADKSARKKSLRFHTSKIESASARKVGARNNAVGGDDDIPYRERRKEKEARLAREAEKKTKVRGNGGDDLDNVEPEPLANGEDIEDDEGADEYYELVKKKSKDKKEGKKVEYEEARKAARPDFEEDTASGPRSLTRAILSNKGLTPHRSKSVRNPRVKKRQKFDKAKKKISSQKAVYKGGIGDSGRYDGEKSGISKVVKSVRLG